MSKQYELAGNIADALIMGERSLNQAAIDMFAVGTAVLKARNSGAFHPLEGQREVERLRVATDNVFDAIGEVARVHDTFWKKVQDMGIVTGTGGLCPWPEREHDEPNGHATNVVELGAQAA